MSKRKKRLDAAQVAVDSNCTLRSNENQQQGATMFGNLRRLVRTTILLTFSLSSCGGKDDSTPVDGPGKAKIGPLGGTVATADGAVVVTVPEGALENPVEITITPVADPPLEGSIVPVVEIGPSGTVFSRPVRITMALTGASVTHPHGVHVATVEDGAWSALPIDSYEGEAGTVAGLATHLSPFGVLDEWCTCNSDSDCADGNASCLDGCNCYAGCSCSDDSQCPAGEVCLDGCFCADACDCDTDADCAKAGKWACEDCVCKEQCDCGPDQPCANGTECLGSCYCMDQCGDGVLQSLEACEVGIPCSGQDGTGFECDLDDCQCYSMCGNGKMEALESCEVGVPCSGENEGQTCDVGYDGADCDCFEMLFDCGDGVLQSGEECEVGIPCSGDNAGMTCDVGEDGASCSCFEMLFNCGDGTLQPGEQCDVGIPCSGDHEGMTCDVGGDGATCTCSGNCQGPDCPGECTEETIDQDCPRYCEENLAYINAHCTETGCEYDPPVDCAKAGNVCHDGKCKDCRKEGEDCGTDEDPACCKDLLCLDGKCGKVVVATYSDSGSGLMWEAVLGLDEPTELSEATAYCEDLDLSGHSDWRVPNISELRSLIRGCANTMTGGGCPTSEEVTAWVQFIENCQSCKYGDGPAPSGCYWPDELEDDECTDRSFISTTPCTDENLGPDEIYAITFSVAGLKYFNLNTSDKGSGRVRCVRSL